MVGYLYVMESNCWVVKVLVMGNMWLDFGVVVGVGY